MSFTNKKHKIQENKGTDIKKDEMEIDKIVEFITLNVFHEGTKQTNYQILQMLPTDVENIMKKTKLTKVPVNKHVNELEKYGLLKREKGTGKVYPTKMTPLFNSLINEIKTQVKMNVSKMLPKLIQ